MSQQALTVKVSGLHTFPSDLSAVPEGALSQADNVVIDRDSVVEPRRGFDYLKHDTTTKSTFSDPSYRANKLFFYQQKIICHYDTSLLAYHNDSTGWTNYSGTYAKPSSTVKVRAAEANQNFYFTTSGGVYKLDAYNGTPSAVGVPAALDLQAAAHNGNNWLADKFRTAYRIVWGIKDANDNVILGAPSQREAYTNGDGASRSIDLTFSIPSGITTAHFFQIYRAAATDNTSATVEPSDEMGLVYEGNPASGDISTGYMTINDIVPDTLRGATLYTSQSQEGLGNANYPPPLALDLAVFRNCLFYANTTSIQSYTVTLLAAGSPNGIQANDTVTIGGIVYTGKASETIASREFKVYSAGSASQNIRDTALSLVRVINRYASSTVYAYYMSGVSDLPGQIRLTARSVGAASFTAASSRATCFNPQIGAATGTSTNEASKNAVFYSKASEPESVPLANFIYVGSADKEILRIIALRDSLFVLKEDGIFRVYGQDPSTFQVALLDNTATVIAPETAVTQNNQIFALTTQGVVTISETGVAIMSRPIEMDLTSLVSAAYTTLQTTSFGVAYESARAYYLFVIGSGADTGPTQYFRYNTITNAWTRGTLEKTCGGVNPVDDKLYLGNSAAAIIDQERKSLTYSDYADYSSTETITAVSGRVVSITSSDTIAVGSIIYQSSTVFGEVESVDSVAGTVTTTLPISFTLAAADVLAPISCALAWVPQAFGNPGITKQVREVALLFKSDFNGTATVSFASDVSPDASSETVDGSQVGGWGLSGWGGPAETPLGTPWGGSNRRRPIRIMVPRNQQRCTLLTVSFSHAFAFSPWEMQGISYIGNGIGERVAA